MSLLSRDIKLLKKAKVFVVSENCIIFLDTACGCGEIMACGFFNLSFKQLKRKSEKLNKMREKNPFYDYNEYNALIRTLYSLAKKEDEEKRDAFIKEYLTKFVQEHKVESYESEVS